jgi:hypothetical protein
MTGEKEVIAAHSIAAHSSSAFRLLHCTAEQFVNDGDCQNTHLLYTDVFLITVWRCWQVHPNRSLYRSGECL